MVAEAFYRTRLQMRVPGVPNAAQRARLRPYLSPALDVALAMAEQAEKEHHAKYKGSVPPLVEGDLFASLFEGVSSFVLQPCTERAPGLQCPLQLTYLDPVTKQKVEWQDTLLLVRVGAMWRISDIAYGGKFLFGQTGLLSDLLRILVKEAKEPKEAAAPAPAPTPPPQAAPPPS